MSFSRYILVVFSLLVFALSACKEKADGVRKDDHLKTWMSDNGKIKILSSTKMVSDLVERVGVGLVDSYALIQGEHNPHSYQLVKGDSEKLARADIIFYNGLGLEHGPSLEHYIEKSNNAYSLGGFILKNEPASIIYLDSVIDPHIWMDVSLWNKTVPLIVEKLSERAPEHAEEFKKRGYELSTELDAIHKEIVKLMEAIPENERYLVTTHDAFNYFAKAYLATKEERADGSWRERFQAPEGLAPESQLSTVDIQNLVEYIEKHKVKIIFAESNVSRDSIKKLVDASKQRGYTVRIASYPLYADAMGSPASQAGTYTKMMLYDAEAIQKELEKP
jgi:manganese/zinc/iron transport system substrate-binding protein